MAIVRLSEYGCEVVKSRGIIRSETSDGSSRLCRSLFDLRMAFAVELVGIAYETFEQRLRHIVARRHGKVIFGNVFGCDTGAGVPFGYSGKPFGGAGLT